MISYAFTAIFWAWALMQLFQKKILHRIVAVLLAVCLTITGIYDFVVIIRNNGPGHRISVNMNSDLTDWLEEHLTHEDLILTPEYSINEVTMSGVMMYMGWPYYAWSAGYDTYYRAAQAKTIYSTINKEELKKLVKQEKSPTFCMKKEWNTNSSTAEKKQLPVYTSWYMKQRTGE